MSEEVKVPKWGNRITLHLTSRNMKLLKKGRQCKVMHENQIYELRANGLPKLFDVAGKALGRAELKKLLRKI